MINEIPTHIYLQVNHYHVEDDIDFKDLEDVTWTSERIYDNDLSYVRSDMVNNFVEDLLAYMDSLNRKESLSEVMKNIYKGCSMFKNDIKEQGNEEEESYEQP